MLAATGVLVSHAYPISLGAGAEEPLERWLHGMSLGKVCVYIFFTISGFFIAKSFDRSPTTERFIKARVLRLYPALFVVLVLTVITSGLLLTDAALGEYWPAAFEYIARNLSLYSLQFSLPGVFENNPYGPAINGSLWTLFHEVVCYLGVFLIGMMGILRRKRVLGVLFLIFVLAQPVLLASEFLPGRLNVFLRLMLPFSIGTAVYVWRDVIPLQFSLGLALIAGAVLSYPTPMFETFFVFALSYWVFLIGLARLSGLLAYNRLGDYSYGMYIYAFPMQQLAALLGQHDPLMNIVLAFPPTLVMAILSWHFVEKPALSLVRVQGFRRSGAAQDPNR